ncbi:MULTISPECIES: hypothetical protein [Caproicibacterium]|uniref:Uncharacterized protein n=1 Tax=Caproicibacterium argilliputei TaxID=3030016 RepID=A0AA97H325_9FIRM|nr:hypothetical protein [Caproicibacterium argilliputei]WOC33375.1 hypothetical protein PXC00_05770 [Caproicibacterium argilliputei]
MKKKWYLIPAALLLVCVVLAFAVRTTYTDTTAQSGQFAYSCSTSLQPVLDSLKVQKVSDIPENLVQNADAIVRAKFDGDRTFSTNAFFSTVKVTQVYKGSQSLKGTDLRIVEAVDYFSFVKTLNAGDSFYIPLQKGDDYLLILKKVPFQSSRKLTDFQKNQYYPYTQSAFGAFRMAQDKQTKLFGKNDKRTLDTLQGYDVPASDQKSLDAYYQVKEKVMQLLKI